MLGLLILGSAISAGAVTVPNGLPRHFGIGLAAQPDNDGLYGWMPQTGIPWDYAYQYLCGGANTCNGCGWATWNDNGQFVTYYCQGADQHGYIPTFSYYQVLQSTGPCDGCAENNRDLANLNSTSVMQAYFRDFILLMKRLGPGTYDGIKGFGKTAIVHIEGDLTGYAEQAVLNNGGACFGFCSGQGNDPALLKAAVASSGVAEAAGFPNTFVGYHLALLHIRDLYAPNVLMALHLSNWSTMYDVGSNTDPGLDVAAKGRMAGEFLNKCGVAQVQSGVSRYDLIFNDVSDRDAGFYKYIYGDQNAFWDRNNVALPHFHQWETYMQAVYSTTGKPAIIWQIPIGNQYFSTMNNSWGHYQDNCAEYFFEHIPELVNVGIIGLQFGCGNDGSTVPWDGRGDGVTNNTPACTTDGISGGGTICNNHTSTVADDDGGYLRMAGEAYFQNPYPLDSTGNHAPVAEAGSDQGVLVSSHVALNGGGSYDPDGHPITYSWQQVQGPAVSLAGAKTVAPSFTAPAAPATLVFRLTVSDATLSNSDQVTITVSTGGGSHHAPVAEAGDNQTVTATSNVILDGTKSSDQDGDVLGFNWQQISGTSASLVGATTATPHFIAPSTAGTLIFRLTVSDGSLSNTDDVSVFVTSGGGALPFISSISNKSHKPGSSATIHGNNFSSNKKDVRVNFGGRNAKILTSTKTTIKINIPKKLKPKSTVNVFVMVKGVKSNSVPFTIK